MWFSVNNAVLIVAQAACVALPAAGLPLWAQRFRTPAWALVLPLSIAIVVGAIELLPSTADLLTWVALVLVPPGCALALGWAARGARPVYAALALPLLAIAWTAPEGRPGQIATTILIAGSAVTLGRLLAGVAPLLLLKAGIVAMAIVDAWLVFSNQLQAPNAVLVAAAPGIGLPQLQSASFGTAGLGYGDFFAAAVVGRDHRRRARPPARCLRAHDRLIAVLGSALPRVRRASRDRSARGGARRRQRRAEAIATGSRHDVADQLNTGRAWPLRSKSSAVTTGRDSGAG